MEDEKKEEVNRGLKLIVKTSIIVLITFLFSKIFGYLYRIIIARHFGPEVYGVFSLAIVIVGWFVALSCMGFIEGVLRYLSLYRGKNEVNKIRYLFRFSSKILILSTLISSLILFFLSDYLSIVIFHNTALIPYLKTFSIMLPFWVFATYFVSIMRAFERIKEASIIDNIMQNLSKVGLLALLIFIGFNSNSIIISFFFGIIILFSFAFFYCRIKLPGIFAEYALNKKIKERISQSFLAYSWPMFFFGIVSGIFYWIDSFMIGFFKTAVEVGFYNAVIPLAILFNIAPEIFLQLFFPMATKEYSLKKIYLIKKISKQIGKWIFMINIPFFVLIFFFPEFVIGILFGKEYIVASNSLRILSAGAIFGSVSIVSNNLLSMAGKSRIIFYDLLGSSAINLILNGILIPMPIILGLNNSLGIVGAALATTISILIFNSLIFIQAKYYTSITPLKKEMLNILLAATLSSTALLFAEKLVPSGILQMILLSIMFLASYFLLLILFRAFDEEDMLIFSSFKKILGSKEPP